MSQIFSFYYAPTVDTHVFSFQEGEVIAQCGDDGTIYAAKKGISIKLSPDEIAEAIVPGELTVTVPEMQTVAVSAICGRICAPVPFLKIQIIVGRIALIPFE